MEDFRHSPYTPMLETRSNQAIEFSRRPCRAVVCFAALSEHHFICFPEVLLDSESRTIGSYQNSLYVLSFKVRVRRLNRLCSWKSFSDQK